MFLNIQNFIESLGTRPLAQSSRRTAAGVRQKKIATSGKLQATSYKRTTKRQATSHKPQASLKERQAASVGCGSNRQAPSKAFRDGR